MKTHMIEFKLNFVY